MLMTRGNIYNAPGDAPVTIVTPGRERTRVLVGDLDWTFPTRLVVRTLSRLGYAFTSAEDPEVLQVRVAIAGIQRRHPAQRGAARAEVTGYMTTATTQPRPERAHMLLLCCRLMNVEADQLTYHPHARDGRARARALRAWENPRERRQPPRGGHQPLLD